MDKKHNFKYIKGACMTGQPADICFYSDVEHWKVQDFIWEFDYLVNSVTPSVIRIHINSAGGNCIDGISVFSKIMDCKIPTQCINDGLAASMASIIWAAGDEIFMKDYALLMIHNPFIEKENGKEYDQVTEAFSKQLSTIYKQRFNLSDENVKSIMDGEEGNDGTFFTAQEAVLSGFLPESNIIKTPEAIKNRVAASLKDTKDIVKIESIMGLANIEEDNTIKTNQIKNSMEKNELTAIAAVLGLVGDKANEASVLAEVNKLKDASSQLETLKAELEDAKKSLTDAQTELNGSKASVANLTKDLETVKASLKEYEDAAEAARIKSIEEMVDQAIAECKLNKDDRETWIEAAQNNLELTKRTIAAIPSREKISEKVVSEESKKEAEEGLKDAEAEMKKLVNDAVGNDFEFRKFDE